MDALGILPVGRTAQAESCHETLSGMSDAGLCQPAVHRHTRVLGPEQTLEEAEGGPTKPGTLCDSAIVLGFSHAGIHILWCRGFPGIALPSAFAEVDGT